MECQALALYTPLRPEEMSLPVRIFHFPTLPDPWQDLTVKQCFCPNAGTGSSVWNAGAQLGLDLSERLAGRRGKALELGCGLGLVSMVLSVLGLEVLATDGNEVVLDCTMDNIRTNGLEGRIQVQQYIWYTLDRGDTVKTQEILQQWGRFDVIVAADVLYGEYEAMDAFIESLAALSDASTELFIAQKVRYPAREHLLQQKLREKFSLQVITSDQLCANLGKQSIYILRKLLV